MNSLKVKYFLFFMFLSSFLIFFGRALQLIIWEAPYRAFFWDERLLKSIVESLLNISWQEYVQSEKVDDFITNLIKASGVILAFSSIATIWIYFKKNIFSRTIVYIGSLLTLLLIYLEFKEKFHHIAQFIEGSIQIFTPILFVFFVYRVISTEKIIYSLKVIISLTFLGHGLYAIGVYPTPGKFIDMTIILLNVKEQIAHNFLMVVGIADVLIIPMLFIKPLTKYALLYAAFWGIVTSFARLFYHIELNDGFTESTFFMVFDTIFRLAHGFVPLALYFLIKKQPHNKNLLNT